MSHLRDPVDHGPEGLPDEAEAGEVEEEVLEEAPGPGVGVGGGQGHVLVAVQVGAVQGAEPLNHLNRKKKKKEGEFELT